jgi:hypothetical protein
LRKPTGQIGDNLALRYGWPRRYAARCAARRFQRDHQGRALAGIVDQICEGDFRSGLKKR